MASVLQPGEISMLRASAHRPVTTLQVHHACLVVVSVALGDLPWVSIKMQVCSMVPKIKGPNSKEHKHLLTTTSSCLCYLQILSEIVSKCGGLDSMTRARMDSEITKLQDAVSHQREAMYDVQQAQHAKGPQPSPTCVTGPAAHPCSLQVGSSEKILKNPIPLSYTRHTARFLVLWLCV